MTYDDLISGFAWAISEMEGPIKRNNPGNIKSRGPDGRFRIRWFPTLSDGWEALTDQLKMAFDGTSRVYHPNLSLLQFFEKYSPRSDRNNPHRYASFVASQLGVGIHNTLAEIKQIKVADFWY